MAVSKWDAVGVALIGFCGAVLSEVLSWFLVLRKPEYKALKVEVDRLQRKFDKEKETAPKNSRKESKVKATEAMLTKKTQEMTALRLKSGLLSGVIYLVIVPIIKGLYDGVVVAKLPFSPILFFRSLAHQSLGGNDYTDCSMMFLYVLAIGTFRTNLQCLLGTAPKKGNGSNGGGGFPSF